MSNRLYANNRLIRYKELIGPIRNSAITLSRDLLAKIIISFKGPLSSPSSPLKLKNAEIIVFINLYIFLSLLR